MQPSDIISRYKQDVFKENRSKIWEMCQSNVSGAIDLDNMVQTGLTYGFFGPVEVEKVYDTIRSLGRYLGLLRHPNPEQPYMPINDPCVFQDDIITALPFKVSLPEFVGGAKLPKTAYGPISHRHCHYLYIVKRIHELYPDKNTRIIEIGAGLGLLPYFLYMAGYKNYTCIDLATANMCQRYFLHKNLPDVEFNILHVSEVPDKIECDLLVNIDGMTEYGVQAAKRYLEIIDYDKFLSINHEVNEYRVCDITVNREYRYPFWLRDGYVEELYNRK